MYFIGAAVQVHELLQETAASITLKPFVTPCSAAVRAQHLRRPPEGCRACQTQTTTQPKKVYYKGIYITFDVWIQHARDFASFSQALSFAYRGRTDRPMGPKQKSFFQKPDFLPSEKRLRNLHGKKCEKSEKITNFEVPRPSKNPPKISLKSKFQKTCKFIICFQIFY